MVLITNISQNYCRHMTLCGVKDSLPSLSTMGLVDEHSVWYNPCTEMTPYHFMLMESILLHYGSQGGSSKVLSLKNYLIIMLTLSRMQLITTPVLTIHQQSWYKAQSDRPGNRSPKCKCFLRFICGWSDNHWKIQNCSWLLDANN